jgi:hypothetical protein
VSGMVTDAGATVSNGTDPLDNLHFSCDFVSASGLTSSRM